MSAIVKINDVELTPIEHRGVRVMTLAMMDEAHRRPEGTARRTFAEHKTRLIEDEDYFVRNSSEARELGLVAPNGLTLLTETGYSMLVKSFTDDLAWNVQRQLVKSYFAKPAAKPARPAAQSLLSDARAIDFIGNMVAKVPGARADVVATIKLRMIEERTGLPATQFGGALPASASETSVKLNPTEIGKRLVPKLKAADVNKALIYLGLQRKSESGYVLTEAGTKHGESRPFQAKNKHIGDQINWYESVVDVIVRSIAPQHPLFGGEQ